MLNNISMRIRMWLNRRDPSVNPMVLAEFALYPLTVWGLTHLKGVYVSFSDAIPSGVFPLIMIWIIFIQTKWWRKLRDSFSFHYSVSELKGHARSQLTMWSTACNVIFRLAKTAAYLGYVILTTLGINSILGLILIKVLCQYWFVELLTVMLYVGLPIWDYLNNAGWVQKANDKISDAGIKIVTYILIYLIVLMIVIPNITDIEVSAWSVIILLILIGTASVMFLKLWIRLIENLDKFFDYMIEEFPWGKVWRFFAWIWWWVPSVNVILVVVTVWVQFQSFKTTLVTAIPTPSLVAAAPSEIAPTLTIEPPATFVPVEPSLTPFFTYTPTETPTAIPPTVTANVFVSPIPGATQDMSLPTPGGPWQQKNCRSTTYLFTTKVPDREPNCDRSAVVFIYDGYTLYVDFSVDKYEARFQVSGNVPASMTCTLNGQSFGLSGKVPVSVGNEKSRLECSNPSLVAITWLP